VERTVVIVGASLAGSMAAITLRQGGFDGKIQLVGAEEVPPYERPALSKGYLRGEVPFDKLLVRPSSFYEDQQIETLYGVRAAAVEPAAHAVQLADGKRLRYDQLLLATGARNRRPPIPGLGLRGVLSLRSVGDADAIRREIEPGKRAVVIGMGFIGCEVAASLRQEGVDVVSIDPAPTPLFRALGQRIGEAIAAVHRDRGVNSIVGDRVAAFEGDGHVRGVVTRRGRRIACDFAVVGIGVEPDVDLVAGCGVAIDDGVLVDEYCRTNIDSIFAAGDVANHHHRLSGRRLRVEHWQNAMQQGAAAARNMLGKQEPYNPVHWFWSDQYDFNLQYAGFHQPSDQLVIRGSIEERKFLAFFMREGRVTAVCALNRGKDLRRAIPLVASRQQVESAQLSDEGVDLRDIIRMSPSASSPL
jgi:3-phenylpropionate/trans-cinnamate dioxygenase ferredoxin reductase subunit